MARPEVPRRWRAATTDLLAPLGIVTERFTAETTAAAPEPVQRLFAATIAPGTPLARAVRLSIRGEIRLGGRWRRFRSQEVLDPVRGLVWWGRVAGIVRGGDCAVDGTGRLEWRLLGLRRVAFAEGPDVVRSGTARAFAEGCLWAPTAVLPGPEVRWTADDDHHVTASTDTAHDAVVHRITLDDDHRITAGVFDRWGDPDDSGTPALHPFGGEVSAWSTFGGVTVASRGAVGWWYGTDRWPDGEFFRYEIDGYQLLHTSD